MIFRAHAYLLMTALFAVGSAWALQKPPLLPPGVSIPVAPEANATVPSVDTNSSHPTKPVRSSQAQTIQQAGRDLRHVEENVRLGAAKLLGKYPGLNTAALLAMALDDRAPRVRRAAIVSIAELYSNGYYLYEKSIVEKILSKLGDVDVEVRREVSALIPRLSIGLFRSSFEIVEINGRKVARSRPATLRPDLRQLALKCLSDEDAIVRQNILKYFSILRLTITSSALEQLLGDEDLGVLLTALSRVSLAAPTPALVGRIEKLADHPDVGVRKKGVAVARDSNRRHPGYREILRKMTADEDPAVLSMAAIELARIGEKVDPKVIRAVGNYLLGVAGASNQVMTILYAVSAFGKQGIAVYRDLTEHSSAKIRTVSWQRLLTYENGWSKPSLWLPAMEDRDKTVRSAIISSLGARASSFDAKTMQALVASDFVDVRSFAAQSLGAAPADALEEVGFDLLIDEDLNVRATTIRAYAGRRAPGWLKIMERSLLDEEYVIRRAAMDGLLSDPGRGLPVLRKFVRENPTNTITPFIATELRNRGISP